MAEGKRQESSPPMSETSSNSYTDEKLKAGYLDEVLDIFNRHNHPFILVEECAMTWMGSLSAVKQDCDVLVRTEQISAILADLLQTGRWTLVNHFNRTQQMKMYADVPRLQRFPPLLPYDTELCLSLWSEEKYHLAVDGPMVEVPDSYACNSVLLEERFNPDDTRGPRTLSAKGIRFVAELQARSEHCKVAMFIPSIPRFIDADLDRYRDNMEKNLLDLGSEPVQPLHTVQLITFLMLDQPDPQKAMLSEMARRHWPMMWHLIDGVMRGELKLQVLTKEQKVALKQLQEERKKQEVVLAEALEVLRKNSIARWRVGVVADMMNGRAAATNGGATATKGDEEAKGLLE